MSAATGTVQTFGATNPSRRTARSIGAVIAGFLVIVGLSSAADAVMHAAGVYPPVPRRMADELFLIATAYRIAFGVLGCYVAARLAPRRPTRHAMVLAGIGTGMAAAGAIAFREHGPAWYSLAVIAISFPCAWSGARLHEARSGAR